MLQAMERRLSKQMKGLKQSLQYDIQKRTGELKNTFVMHKVPTVGDSVRNTTKMLGIKLPISDDVTFVDFNETLLDVDKETALV